MNYRKLQIAWSAVWGAACLLLVVLWVRSSYFNDSLYIELSNSRCLDFDVMRGSVAFAVFPRSAMPPNYNWWFAFAEATPGLHRPAGFVAIPIWSLIVIGATIATTSWMKWTKRFSLRTIFIGVTVLAVLLGVIAATTLTGR